MKISIFSLFLFLGLAVLCSLGNFFSLPDLSSKPKITIKQLSLGLFIYLFAGSVPLLLEFENQSWLSQLSLSLQGIFMLTCIRFYIKRLPRESQISILWAGHTEPKKLKSMLFNILRAWIIVMPTTQFISILLVKCSKLWVNIQKLHSQEITNEILSHLNHSSIRLTLILLTVIVLAPISEELIFRGLFQNYLKTRTSRIKSILISSFVFSLTHIENSLGSLIFVPTIFCLSLFLGFIYEKEKHIVAPIILHSLYNATQIFATLG